MSSESKNTRIEEAVTRMKAMVAEDLKRLKESVLQIVPAEAIYLFGSYAYGTPTDESDLDVYVVVPDDTPDLSEAYADIQVLMNRRSVPIDLLIGRSAVFNRRKEGPTLERVVALRGTKLYGS